MLDINCPAILALAPNSKLQVSSDGLVRLDFDIFCSLPFEHIVSGLSSSLEKNHLAGYTEWLYENGSPITLGWDWQWIWKNQKMELMPIGQPRSNIQLQIDNIDLSPRHNAKLLSKAIEMYIDWQNTTTNAIRQRNSIN